jgi:hypothetical protein
MGMSFSSGQDGILLYSIAIVCDSARGCVLGFEIDNVAVHVEVWRWIIVQATEVVV